MKSLSEYIVEGIFDVDDNIKNIDKQIKEDIKKFLKENFIGASNCKISRNPNNNGKYEVLTSLKGAPKKVGRDFDCSRCGVEFTKEDVEKVSKVKGNIYV